MEKIVKKKSKKLLNQILVGYNLPQEYLEHKIKKANIIDDIVNTLELEQLTGENSKKFYVDTNKVRGTDSYHILKGYLTKSRNPYIKLLFSGYSGSGKTTELIKLYEYFKEKVNIIIFSVRNRISGDEITIESVIFEIIEDVLVSISEYGVKEDKKLLAILNNIKNWCSETKITKSVQEYGEIDFGAKINFLKLVFLNAKKEVSTNVSRIDTYIEPKRLNELILICNDLFSYIKEYTQKDVIILIDDIEKMSYGHIKDFYINGAYLIEQLHCKMVLTIPVELVYTHDYSLFEGRFNEAEILPMIKIKDVNGEEFEDGINILTEILKKRVDLSLFQDECYMDAIKFSGGSIRDMFRIIQRASIIESSSIITKDSMLKSINYHKQAFESRISESREGDTIAFKDYIKALIDIYNGNRKNPERTIALLNLQSFRAIMKYDGEGFYDIHPLLEDFVKNYKAKYEN